MKQIIRNLALTLDCTECDDHPQDLQDKIHRRGTFNRPSSSAFTPYTLGSVYQATEDIWRAALNLVCLILHIQ